MMQEFFGKPFRFALLALVGMFCFSSIAYFFHLEFLFLFFLALITIVSTYRRLEWGIAIAFLELISNAHGYLFFHSIGSIVVSARMIIFLSVFFGWLIAIIMKRSFFKLNDKRLILFYPIFFGVTTGFVIGILKRSFVEVFQDGNAYFYLFYLLPILHVHWDKVKQRAILQFLAAGALFTSVSSILLLYGYTHYSEAVLKTVYIFLRDIRFAEITRLPFGMYRIFEQTQLFVLLFGLILIPRLFFSQSKKDRLLTIFLTSLVFTTAFIGMSRSFWLGMIVAGIVILCSFIFLQRPGWKKLLLGTLHVLASVLVAALLLLGAVLFPFPHGNVFGDLSSSVGSRLSDSDAGVSSRWNLLNPMLESILESPVLGGGFGQTVSFKTDDPRIRALYPDGSWTTSSMEWGWLEIWLKMGILAPIGFITLFVIFFRSAKKLFSTPKAWLGLWIISSMVFLYATQMFSPYLNHPIGLGTILMLFIFLPPNFGIGLFVTKYFLKQKMPQPNFATPSVQTIKTK